MLQDGSRESDYKPVAGTTLYQFCNISELHALLYIRLYPGYTFKTSLVVSRGVGCPLYSGSDEDTFILPAGKGEMNIMDKS